MSSNFIPLEEAAKRLGVTAEQLVEMRSRGDIFGYRDGSSWKFKPEEIERVASEVLGDALDEEPAGSSILVSEQEVGPAGSKVGSTIGSDIQLAADVGSDVSLVPDLGSGSDVKLVAGKAAKPAGDSLDIASGSDIKPGSSKRLGDSELKLASDDDDDDELHLQADEELSISAGSAAGSGVGSDVELGSDLSLSLGEGSDLLASLSDKPAGSGKIGSDVSLGSDLALSSDEDDLVLGGGSDLAIGNDSGINLMSPSDSGISLEDEPLDLAGSGISGLDLGAESSKAGVSGLGSGAGSGVGEEFQLSPAAAVESDDDSGSQVIELEDSGEFAGAAVALPAEDGGFGEGGFDADAGGFGTDDGLGTGSGMAPGPVMVGAPDVPFGTPMVLVLLGILMIMCMSGMLVTDMMRNMWQWSGGSSDLTSGFTKAVVSIWPK